MNNIPTIAGLNTEELLAIFEPMMGLLAAIAYTLGLLLIMNGLWKGVHCTGHNARFSLGNVIGTLVCGVIMIALPGFEDIFSKTLFTSESANWMAYSNEHTKGFSEQAKETFKVVLMFVVIVGWISFMRGVSVLNAAVGGGRGGNPNQGWGTALVWMVCGVMAINVTTMIDILSSLVITS